LSTLHTFIASGRGPMSLYESFKKKKLYEIKIHDPMTLKT